MKIYYQIVSNGKTIKVLKPLFEDSNINKKIFDKRSKRINIDQLKEVIPSPYSNLLISCMRRVEEINYMKLSKLGVKVDKNTNQTVYCVGNCEFDDINKAINHGIIVYGYDFIDDNKEKLKGVKMYYFKDKEMLNEKTYISLCLEYKELLKVKSIKINKDKKPNPKKY